MTAKKRQANGDEMSPDAIRAISQLSSTALVALILGYFIHVIGKDAEGDRILNQAAITGQQAIIRECVANAVEKRQ